MELSAKEVPDALQEQPRPAATQAPISDPGEPRACEMPSAYQVDQHACHTAERLSMLRGGHCRVPPVAKGERGAPHRKQGDDLAHLMREVISYHQWQSVAIIHHFEGDLAHRPHRRLERRRGLDPSVPAVVERT